MLKILALVCLLLSLGACSHGTQTSDPLTYPLNQIYWAVESSLSMGIQSYSENRREITSRPFITLQSNEAKKNKWHERGRAVVTIYGSERPYTVEATVAIERSENGADGDYSITRYDKGLAEKLLRDILLAIKKSDRTKNVIDDFRSF